VSDDLLWAYCVAGAEPSATVVGVRARPVRAVGVGDISALVSEVPRGEFAEEALRRNLNDLQWLADVARAHEGVLEQVLQDTTIVPLRLCTIFESDAGVERMLEQEHDALASALAVLSGREEWGVKLLVDKSTLAQVVEETSDEAAALRAEMKGKSEAGAYLSRRKLERVVRDAADQLAAAAADELKAMLAMRVLDVVTRPPQNPQLSGYAGAMLLNAACLVDQGDVSRLRGVASEFEQHYAQLGAHVELTGPWPPYNFVPGADA
jgi:hypothetical protein